MSSLRLEVRAAGRTVGAIETNPDGKMHFRYASDWLSWPGRFALSVSLPLQQAPHLEPAHRFFANLLPEGALRQAVCRWLGLSIDNDAALLAALGEDCAGALQVIPAGHPLTAGRKLVPLTNQQLSRWDEKNTALGSVVAQGGARLSLAGAQDKLPVVLGERGRLFLPCGGLPSTHLLKLGNARFHHLPENEVVMMRLAERVGVKTVPVVLRRAGSAWQCLVTRYDRRRIGDRVVRLHQEDFCQALGHAAHIKYEAEGGPSFAICLELLRRVSVEPLADTKQLLRWQVFNALAGNCDGHAKNLSILHTPTGPRLAPFYDMVCTRLYPDLSHRLAMSVGSGWDAANLDRVHWERFAREIGVRPLFVIEVVRTMASYLVESAKDVMAQIEKETRRSVALQSLLLQLLRKLTRRARKL